MSFARVLDMPSSWIDQWKIVLRRSYLTVTDSQHNHMRCLSSVPLKHTMARTRRRPYDVKACQVNASLDVFLNISQHAEKLVITWQWLLWWMIMSRYSVVLTRLNNFQAQCIAIQDVDESLYRNLHTLCCANRWHTWDPCSLSVRMIHGWNSTTFSWSLRLVTDRGKRSVVNSGFVRWNEDTWSWLWFGISGSTVWQHRRLRFKDL